MCTVCSAVCPLGSGVCSTEKPPGANVLAQPCGITWESFQGLDNFKEVSL